MSGSVPAAENYGNAALEAFPDYHYGLAALAQVRVAEALSHAGQKEEAETAFADFEREASLEARERDRSWRFEKTKPIFGSGLLE